MQDFLTKGSVCFLSLDMGYGGAEKVIATLSNELVRSGREVTIVTLFEQNDFKHALDPYQTSDPINKKFQDVIFFSEPLYL